MSFRERVERLTDNHYVLPRIGAMRVDVHAFLSPALLAQTDEALWQQAAQAAAYPGIVGFYLMPDTHLGLRHPRRRRRRDRRRHHPGRQRLRHLVRRALPASVPELTAADVADEDKRRRWIRAVEARVATGVGSHRPRHMPRFSERDVEEILRYGAKALGVDADLCERQYIAVDDAALDTDRIGRARDKALPQLGSVGGGNHFIEMQVDRDDGSVWVMIHCGSRGYGWQTANHYFYAGARAARSAEEPPRGIVAARRRAARSRILGASQLARRTTPSRTGTSSCAACSRRSRTCSPRRGEVFYEISHNLVQQETLVLPDGRTQRGFVHRKGATRAFPAGHPDLVGTQWETTGHPCLVPGSMLRRRGDPVSAGGRVRLGLLREPRRRAASWRAARRSASSRRCKHDIDREMRTITRTLGGVQIRGIVGNTEHTPLDECGHVYKDLDAVLRVLEGEGIARVAQRLYPVANIKGTD